MKIRTLKVTMNEHNKNREDKVFLSAFYIFSFSIKYEALGCLQIKVWKNRAMSKEHPPWTNCELEEGTRELKTSDFISSDPTKNDSSFVAWKKKKRSVRYD